jgi:hypothetical protein
VGVGVMVGVGVGVGVDVTVGVGVTVGVLVGVGVGVAVSGGTVLVGVGVGVAVSGGTVLVGVTVTVGIGVPVGVGVDVGSGVGVNVGMSTTSIQIELLQFSVSATNLTYRYPSSRLTVCPVNSCNLLTFSPVLPVMATQSTQPDVGHWYISKFVMFVLPVIVIVVENDILINILYYFYFIL